MADNKDNTQQPLTESETKPVAVMSLSALKRNNVNSGAAHDAYRELLQHPNQKPGMPPHGARRSMGKR